MKNLNIVLLLAILVTQDIAAQDHVGRVSKTWLCASEKSQNISFYSLVSEYGREYCLGLPRDEAQREEVVEQLEKLLAKGRRIQIKIRYPLPVIEINDFNKIAELVSCPQSCLELKCGVGYECRMHWNAECPVSCVPRRNPPPDRDW